MALTDKGPRRIAESHAVPEAPQGATQGAPQETTATSPAALSHAVAIRLARRLTADAIHPGELLDDQLEASLAAGHAIQMAGMDIAGRLEWALARIARLEARLLTLQAAMLQAPAPNPPPALPHAVAAAPVAKPPTVKPTLARAAPAPVAPAATHAEPPRVGVTETMVSFDANLRCKGFYESENRPGKPPSRWVGPSTQAELWLPRIGEPVELRFAIAGIFVPGVLSEIRFSVDGGPWIKPELQEVDGVRFLRLRPPPGPSDAADMMHIAIETVLQDSPVNRGSTDTRRLSIAFWRLEARRA